MTTIVITACEGEKLARMVRLVNEAKGPQIKMSVRLDGIVFSSQLTALSPVLSPGDAKMWLDGFVSGLKYSGCTSGGSE